MVETMINIPTLALATGLGNLAFAALASVYMWNAHADNPPLRIWRWACLLSGAAMFLSGMRLSLWHGVVLLHVLLFVSSALQFAAYARLLGVHDWRRSLTGLTVLAVLGRIVLAAEGVARSVDLVYLSLVDGGYLTAMACLCWISARQNRPLLKLIAFTNTLVALLFFVRAGWGIWVEPLVPLGAYPVNIALWVTGYLIILINGFGFLLLTKQQDDDALRAALAEIANAEAEQRQLLSLASHEFRTPAAIIKSSLDSLDYVKDPLPPAVSSRLVNIHKATQRLIHLANALIAQDRLRELHFGLNLTTVNVYALIQEVVDTYSVTIHWPQSQGVLNAQVDADLLTIVLHNLVDNALRHAGNRDVPVIRLAQDAFWLEISVSDHGPGVPDHEKLAIFERFHRNDTSKGSGLGLSFVEKIVRLHGGTVTVRDNQPSGAVFVVRLPVAVLELSAVPVHAPD